MSASYGWRIVRPPEPADGFSVGIAAVLAEYLMSDEHARTDLAGWELGSDALPFLKGLHAGLAAGEDAVDVKRMIEDIERHGAISLTVER